MRVRIVLRRDIVSVPEIPEWIKKLLPTAIFAAIGLMVAWLWVTEYLDK